MSSEDITAVLLPAAEVDFFLTDSNSYNIASNLESDWRFARVNIQTSKQGMQGAIEYYQDNASPELIVVETDNIDDNFLSDLEKLSSLCTEGTDAVIIGPKNDVKLYRSLMELGVKDYLVRPVDEDELVKVVAKLLVDKKGLTGSKLISVIGAKGGMGITTISQLIANDIANNLEQKTMIMDVSGAVSTLGIVFGINSSNRLSEVVRIAEEGSDDDVKRVCQSVGENLSVLTCGADSILTPIPCADKVEVLIKRLMKKYPFIVVDLSLSSRDVIKRVIEISSEVVVVSNTVMSSLRNTKALLGEINRTRANLKEVDLVINMQGLAEGDEVPMQDIKTALDFEPTLKIKYLPKLFLNAEIKASPIGSGVEDKKIMADIRKITAKLVDVKMSKDKDEGKKPLKLNSVGEKLKGIFKA